MPSYYDDEEEGDDSAPNMGPDVVTLTPGVNMGTGQMGPTPMFSQEQAAARDAVLSQALPEPAPGYASPAGPVQVTPGQMMGAATREYLSGRPGLFVQGGPSVPAGTIQVNGQLERSQAAPQPVPWWISAADEFKEQRRQEDFLRSLVAQAGPQGEQAVGRFKQLQARMNVDAAVKKGIPLRDALAQNPDALGGSTAALARVAAIRPERKPFVPTEITLPSGRKATQLSPQRYSIEKGEPELTKGQKASYYIHRAKQAQSDYAAAEKEGDTKAMADAKKQIKDYNDKANSLVEGKEQPKQTQTSPRIAKANQLAAQFKQDHPDWSDESIKKAVIDAIKGLK